MKLSPLFFCTGLLLSGAISAIFAEQPAASPEPAPSQSKQLPEIRLVEQFDQNGDHRLDASERQKARAYLAKETLLVAAPAPTRPGTPQPQAVALEPSKAGEKISPASVHSFPDKSLYETGVVRTLFLEFENTGWEKELTEFARTDVSIPAKLIFDGKDYAEVGVHFRSPAATPVTPKGYKRALTLNLDYTHTDQTIESQRQLVLLDAATDPTFVRTLLYNHIARQYTHAPLANLVRVVINGENWGIYVSVEPFDAPFIKKSFGTTDGAWWTVSPGGNLAYLGDKVEAYKSSYHLQSKEDSAAWSALIDLCKILNQTPSSEIESAIAKRLDIDSALRFFALENALINQDGYGGENGGYGLYLGKDGRFQIVPQDAEASLRLIEVSEFEKGAKRGGRERSGPKSDKPTDDKDSSNQTPSDKVLQSYNPNNFPRQAATDLAMLLSYSFVNKADSDFDAKVTREEWQAFARSWFLVMDEDLVGKLTRDQFLAKFRGLLTPASVADGRTKQTFGKDDAAGIIGQDFFKAMDQNHDEQLTSQEVTDTFAQWFPQWSDPKKAVITQPGLQRAFNSLFSRTIFQAEQSYIARHDTPVRGDEESGGRGNGRGRSGGGNGIGIGALRIGGHGGRGGDSRILVTFSEELDPLAGLDEQAKPLLTKLLSVPVLRIRYLEYVRDINDNWLSWSKLGPIARQSRELIAAEVEKETHKATSYAHFVQEFDQDTTQGSRDGDAAPSLKSFVNERHSYLMKDDNVMGTSTNP